MRVRTSRWVVAGAAGLLVALLAAPRIVPRVDPRRSAQSLPILAFGPAPTHHSPAPDLPRSVEITLEEDRDLAGRPAFSAGAACRPLSILASATERGPFPRDWAFARHAGFLERQ
jgi:hypothetical protein